MAGCLVLGPVPLDRSDLFKSHMVPLSSSLTDAQIVRAVSYWLSGPMDRERRAKAKGMQDWVRREFGVERYVEQVMALVEERRRGRKGMRLPWQWEPASSAVAKDG